MTFSSPTQRGSNTTQAAGTTLDVTTFSGAMAVGQLIFVNTVTDNYVTEDGESSQHSISDTKGNTWVKIRENTETDGVAADGVTVATFCTKVKTQIETTDTITLTCANSVACKIISVFELSHNAESNVGIVQVGVGQAAVSASVSGLPSNAYFLLGHGGAEGTDASKSPDADYLELYDLRTDNTGNQITQHVVYRIATLTSDTCTSGTWTNTNPTFLLIALAEMPDCADNVTVADTPIVSMAMDISVSDGVTVADTVSVEIVTVVVDLDINVNDGLTLGENNTQAINDLGIIKSENVSLGETNASDVRAAWYNPDSITVNTGSVVSGTIEDTWSDGGAKLQLAETVGTPGFDYDFYFYDVPADALSIVINGYYDGQPSHNIKIRQYNFTTTNWTDLGPDTTDFPTNTSDQDHQFALFGGPNYNSGGQVRLKIVHISPGNPTHNFYIDHMIMSQQTLVVHIPDENLTLGETINVTLADNLIASVSDGVTLNESVQQAVSDISTSVTDGLTLADILPGRYIDNISLGEQVTVELEVVADLAIDVSDGVTLGEVIVASLSDALIISTNDDITLGEITNIIFPNALEIFISENITLGEITNAILPSALAIIVNDSITLGETKNVILPDALTIGTNEDVTLGETISIALPDVLMIIINENITLGEIVSTILPNALVIVINENITLGETTNEILPNVLSISVSDGITLGEIINVIFSDALIIDISENITLEEIINAILPDALVTSESDNITLGDVINIAFEAISALEISVTDSIQVVDPPFIGNSIPEITVVDGITLGEITTTLLPDDLVVFTSDNVIVEELSNVIREIEGVLYVSASDGVTLGEVIAVTLNDLVLSQTDNVALGEEIATSLSDNLIISQADNIAVGEANATELPNDLIISQTDGITVGEINITTLPNNLVASVSDNITLEDVINIIEEVEGELYVTVSDGVTLSEATIVSLADALQVIETDGLTLGEDWTVSFVEIGAFDVNVSDNLTLGELIEVSLPDALVVSSTDNITLGEDVTVSLIEASVFAISVTDNLTLGEDVTTIPPDDLALSTADSLTLGEIYSVSLIEASVFEISVTDNLTLGEFVTINLPDALAISETDGVTLGEIASLLVYTSMAAAETHSFVAYIDQATDWEAYIDRQLDVQLYRR